jgi:hypothetical protein
MSANVQGTQSASQGNMSASHGNMQPASQGPMPAAMPAAISEPGAMPRTAQGTQAGSQQSASRQPSTPDTPAESKGSGQSPVPLSASLFEKHPGRQSRVRSRKRESCDPVPDSEKAPDRHSTGGSTRLITGGPPQDSETNDDDQLPAAHDPTRRMNMNTVFLEFPSTCMMADANAAFMDQAAEDFRAASLILRAKELAEEEKDVLHVVGQFFESVEADETLEQVPVQAYFSSPDPFSYPAYVPYADYVDPDSFSDQSPMTSDGQPSSMDSDQKKNQDQKVNPKIEKINMNNPHAKNLILAAQKFVSAIQGMGNKEEEPVPLAPNQFPSPSANPIPMSTDPNNPIPMSTDPNNASSPVSLTPDSTIDPNTPDIPVKKFRKTALMKSNTLIRDRYCLLLDPNHQEWLRRNRMQHWIEPCSPEQRQAAINRTDPTHATYDSGADYYSGRDSEPECTCRLCDSSYESSSGQSSASSIMDTPSDPKYDDEDEPSLSPEEEGTRGNPMSVDESA